jgi:hypothetical protein
MPGNLVPSDLDRLIPATVIDVLKWAEANLLASPGAIVRYGGQLYRIPTLVPATKPDGSCVHLTPDNRCDIHAIAPFGCAFFDCKTAQPEGAASAALMAVSEAWYNGLYGRIWRHLWAVGKRQHGPEVLRARMREAEVAR